LFDRFVLVYFRRRPHENIEIEYRLVGKDLLTNVLMLDIGYRLQTFTIELQSAVFAFLLADKDKTQNIINHLLGLLSKEFLVLFIVRCLNDMLSEVLSPIVQSGQGALQKISRISSDEYRQRLFHIIRMECHLNEPDDDMIDFYSIMIHIDQSRTIVEFQSTCIVDDLCSIFSWQ
jgi:hypothetical protein